MKQMLRRYLALALALIMVFGICDMQVFASPYGENAASEAKTIEVAGVNNAQSRVMYEYKVTLPDGYDASDTGRRYPVVYLMPENGLVGNRTAVTDTLASVLAGDTIQSVIVVEPVFISPQVNEEAGVYHTMQAIVEAVDSAYNTVAQPSSRAVVGMGVGGYLASMLTYTDGAGTMLTEPGLFGMSASIQGDYESSENIWKTMYGDFYTITANDGVGNGKLTNAIANKFYTYMTAAAQEDIVSVDGGAKDIIAYFINRGGAYGGFYYGYYGNADSSVLDLTVKNSVCDDAFCAKAVTEAIGGIGDKLAQNIVTGVLSVTPQAAYESVPSVSAKYDLTVGSLYTAYCADAESPLRLTISMTDPDSGEKVAEDQTVDLLVKEGIYNNEEAAITLPNIIVNGSTTITLSCDILGKHIILDSKPLIRVAATGSEPENQLIDLLGDWSFYAFKGDGSDDKMTLTAGTLPAKEEYDTWEQVQPCLGWWNSSLSQVTDMKSYAGYAWYIKEFDIPADFPEGEYYVPVGYFDETDICFINGVEIGCTGLDETTWKHAEDCWDTERIYSISSDKLNIGGTNVMMVLTHNQSGDGGWYDGHPGLYSTAAYNKMTSRPSTSASAQDTAIVEQTVAEQMKAIKAKNSKAYADTVDSEYFQSGRDKSMLLEEVASYMQGASKINIADSNTYVFTTGDLLYYQADRIIKTAAGETKNLTVEEYYKIENGRAYLYGQHDRFYTQTIDSTYKAQAQQSADSSLSENFLVYLPEGYFDSANADKRYPVAYVLHQINSSSNSYAIDGINELMDQGIASGDIKDMILVIPDSSKQSWWMNGWDKMVTEEILPFVDEHYRTIADARYRITTGASMGGGGAYYIGLTNPDLFTGITSFFGAINMGGKPLNIAQSSSSEYLSYFNQFFVAGNRDFYKFGVPAITLDKLLGSYGISHFFELEEGEHDSIFYLPYVIESFAYQTGAMNTVTDEEAAGIVSGSITGCAITDQTAVIEADLTVTEGVSGYLNTIPASSYTKNTNPNLTIPVTATIAKDGKIICSQTQNISASAAMSEHLTWTCTSTDLSGDAGYDVSVTANILTGCVSLGTDSVTGTPDVSQIEDQSYTGKPIKPEVTVTYENRKLEENKDYSVSYRNNTAVGTAVAVVRGLGEFEQFSQNSYFEITERNLETVSLETIADQEYTGKRIRPEVTLRYRGTVIPEENYTLSYSSNQDIGTAAVTITGKNNYTGSIHAEYQIVPAAQTISVNKTSYQVKCGAQNLDLAAEAASPIAEVGVLTYSSSSTAVAQVDKNGIVKIGKAGTADIVIKAAATEHSAAAQVMVQITVAPAVQQISLAKTSYEKTFGNKAFTLGASVKAELEAAGTLSYKSSDTSVAKVDSKGKVSIVGAGKAVITVTAAATDYCSAAAEKVEVTAAPKKLTLSSVKSSRAKELTIKWKKDSKASGYEIVYSKKSSFKSAAKVTISKRTTVSKKIRVKTAATYYVKARAYKKAADGTKIYGAYSKSRKVTVAK